MDLAISYPVTVAQKERLRMFMKVKGIKIQHVGFGKLA